MTFLEFVCQTLLGSPMRVLSSGEAQWECPYCGDSNGKFHTRPLSKRFPKQRFSCYKCAEWGDEWNLIALLNPDEDHAQHVSHWKVLRDGWEALDPAQPLTAASGHHGRQRPQQPTDSEFSFSRDDQGRPPTDPVVLMKAPSRMVRSEHDLLVRALRIAWRENCDLTELAEEVCRRQESEQLHRMACDDPDCAWAVCRRARGLPPLTKAEIEQAKQERREFNEENHDLSPAGRQHAWKHRNGSVE